MSARHRRRVRPPVPRHGDLTTWFYKDGHDRVWRWDGARWVRIESEIAQ